MGLEDQFESLQMTTGGLIQEWLPSTEGYVQGREASMESEESTFEPAHVQLIGVECYDPPRFIFYPISWDGFEDLPLASGLDCSRSDSGADDVRFPELNDLEINLPSAMIHLEDPFTSINHWRQDVVTCGSPQDELRRTTDVPQCGASLLSFTVERYRTAITPSDGYDSLLTADRWDSRFAQM